MCGSSSITKLPGAGTRTQGADIVRRRFELFPSIFNMRSDWAVGIDLAESSRSGSVFNVLHFKQDFAQRRMVNHKIDKLGNSRELGFALEWDILRNQVFLEERLAVSGFVRHLTMVLCPWVQN